MMAIAFALIATVSCKKEAKDAETVVVDNVEKVVEKTNVAAENLATSTFKIDGMTCQIGCAAKIEKSLSKMEGVQSAKVDFDTKTATVSYDVDKVTTDLLAARVVSNGDQYKVDFAKSCKPGCTKPCCAKEGKKSCSAKKCDVKCSPDCKDANCAKCAAKKAECKAKCAANKAKCSAKKCDVKCSPDCKDANCAKCAAKKVACKTKCASKKATCKEGCTKPCCAKKP